MANTSLHEHRAATQLCSQTGSAHNITSEKIVFEDKLTTAHSLDGVLFRRREEADGDWALEVDGSVAATGGILYHYNRPYGDIYMEVAEPFRLRGRVPTAGRS